MTTLTITPNPDTGSHGLAIASTAAVTRIQRTDANGTYDVRTLAGLLPAAPVLVEYLRNRVIYPQGQTTGYSATRCTLSVVDSSYCRATAAGSGSSYFGPGTFAGGINNRMPVTPGDMVAARVFLRNPMASARSARLRLFWYDAAGAAVGLVADGAMVTIAAGNNTNTASVTGTAPAGAVTALALLWWYDGAGATPVAGDTLDYRYWGIYVGPNAWVNPAVYFHGSYADTTDDDFSWTGTAYASESIWSKPAALVLDDYEASAGTSTYTVTTALDTVSGSGALTIDSPWLGLPVTPQFSARVDSVTGYEAGVDSLSTVIEPSGGNVPLVIFRGGSTRRGSLDVWAGSYAAALALLRLVQRGQIIMLRQAENPGMDMFFHASRAGITTLLQPANKPTVFGVRLDYIEVGRPAAPLSGALGWTWGTLKNSAASWADVFAGYATWGDIRTNRRKAGQ